MEQFVDENYLVYFGDHTADLGYLKSKFNYKFNTLHQVHGDKSVKSVKKSIEVEADAHFTSDIGQALVIKTADCLSVLLAGKDKVFAIHAGWRGLANNIIKKSILNENSKELRVYVGPHIKRESFEVGEDLLAYFDKKYFTPKGNKKYNLDLTLIVQDQLLDLGIAKEKIIISKVNTFTNENYNSFRLNKTKKRNLSFIVKLC